MSWQLGALDPWLRLAEKPRLARATSVPAGAGADGAAGGAAGLAAGSRRGACSAGDRRCGWPGRRGRGVLLWLHGGAYCLGSPRTHASLVAGLAAPRRAGGGAAALPPRARARLSRGGRGRPRGLGRRFAPKAGRPARSRSAATAPAAGSPSRCCTCCSPRACRRRPACCRLQPLGRPDARGREPRRARAPRRAPARASARRCPRPLPRRRRSARPARLALARPFRRRAAGDDPGEPAPRSCSTTPG